MKRKHRVILVVLAVLVLGYLGIKIAMGRVEAAHQRLFAEIIADVDLTKIADGTYDGSYSLFPVMAEVKVAVTDHRITDIKLIKHRNGQGSWAEAMLTKVVDAQSLDVDIVTGATLSSKVILRAIAEALGQ